MSDNTVKGTAPPAAVRNDELIGRGFVGGAHWASRKQIVIARNVVTKQSKTGRKCNFDRLSYRISVP